MWLKFILAILIIAFCTLMGYFAAEKQIERKKFFVQYNLFHARYLNELNYARRPLSEFLSEYKYTGDFGKCVEKYRKSHKSEIKLKYLTKDERAQSEDYFSMLGKGDALSQKSYFSAQTENLETLQRESEKEAKRRKELCMKLGLLAGLAIVILIV